ncbi:hypothetical protein [Cochleicola gelatinilyticus]|uniref:Uncharacterized protein n=1 Tax=Cochleicola gelatinilyticus TaxID=1763537 RepID=A0A167KFG9_9FLAO|nr:hypothetical protein [Cochleicola gelatinilyticus]OAB81835.1 hypothetical protein ULVI_00425 [Cochleicola gelatinilyticus]
MDRSYLVFFIPVLLVATAWMSFNGNAGEYVPVTEMNTQDTDAYHTMMSVISHPRCVNCHPNDNIPKRGMEGTPHPFGRDGETSDLSFDVLLCASCHKEENDDFAGQPGAPHWDLAPRSMAWEGLSKAEIAASMLNPKNNGNRSHEDILKHLTEDELVLWAFEPGLHPDGTPREKPPVSEDDFIAAVKIWFANGAVIPQE